MGHPPGQLTPRDTFVEFDMDNYQVNMVATVRAALRKKYTKALPSGSDDFPVFVTTSLLRLLQQGQGSRGSRRGMRLRQGLLGYA